jgi:sulfur relay (sulfurtransferase) DsrC/TusE family protein
VEIKWERGSSAESKTKLLQYYRDKYERYKKSDPMGILIKMKQWKEMKKT